MSAWPITGPKHRGLENKQGHWALQVTRDRCCRELGEPLLIVPGGVLTPTAHQERAGDPHCDVSLLLLTVQCLCVMGRHDHGDSKAAVHRGILHGVQGRVQGPCSQGLRPWPVMLSPVLMPSPLSSSGAFKEASLLEGGQGESGEKHLFSLLAQHPALSGPSPPLPQGVFALFPPNSERGPVSPPGALLSTGNKAKRGSSAFLGFTLLLLPSVVSD